MITRRGTDRPTVWEIGARVKGGGSANRSRLGALEAGGATRWEISRPAAADAIGRHPYVYDLIDNICGLRSRPNWPPAPTIRRSTAEAFATEVLDPAGSTWDLPIIELRAWLATAGYIDEPAEQYVTMT